MTNYQTTKYINGPYNLVRLEGYVNNIKKIIYIFFDKHVYFTKCDNKYALNFMQYIIRETKNNNIKYDLFIETRFNNNLSILKNEELLSLDYLMSIVWTFRKLDLNDNKVHNYNDNIRIQFMDWRTNYVLNTIFNFSNINVHNNSFDYENIIKELDSYLYSINIIIKYYNEIKLMPNNIFNKNIVEYFNDYKNNPKSKGYHSDILTNDHNYKLIWKLYNSYKYKNIKEKINKLINDHLSRLEIHVIELLDIKKDLEKFNFNNNGLMFVGNINQIKDYFIIGEKIEHLIYNITYIITGLHFELHLIRRFLDKDYISNAISYSGSLHSFYLIFLLIKYFDFKITNICYNNSNLNIDKINEKINKSEFNSNNINVDIVNIFDENIMSAINYQCVNMESFPEKFM